MAEFETEYRPIPETADEARARFVRNYYERGGTDPQWLADHIDVLVQIAVPRPRPSNYRQTRPKRKQQPAAEPLPWGRLVEMFGGDRELVEA